MVRSASNRPQALAAAAAAMFCVASPGAQTPVCGYEVVHTNPHDASAYTQGLLYSAGELFESTGLYGESSLRRVVLETGQVVQSIDLDAGYFAEGLAMWQDRLLQLTWQENTCFVWDAATFAPIGSYIYSGQGWGLTHDGRELIMSDGSAILTFRDPDTFAVVRTVEVVDGGTPVVHLNELEWIRGEVFANQWLTDQIARIDPDTGEVIAWIDLSGLLDPVPPGAEVLNGIAWDDAGERLFVTGKFWPSLFEIELVGCPELRLFFDGFERGDTRGWSSATPSISSSARPRWSGTSRSAPPPWRPPNTRPPKCPWRRLLTTAGGWWSSADDRSRGEGSRWRFPTSPVVGGGSRDHSK